VALLFTGILLITTRRTVETARHAEPGWGQALVIGCAQALAIVPGISRSGATVSVALALGVAPLAATEFSFLMAIAAIAGAAVLALPDATAVSPGEVEAFLVGGLVALGSGLAALWLFVRLLRSRRFHQFAYYVWVVGTAFLIWILVTS
jgi:undecaprenyl-diphosphatase